MYFFETDAIAGISGGTEIKYIDTTTGVNVSGYGNVIGAIPLWNYTSTMRLITTSSRGGIVFAVADANGKEMSSTYSIRVYYY